MCRAHYGGKHAYSHSNITNWQLTDVQVHSMIHRREQYTNRGWWTVVSYELYLDTVPRLGSPHSSQILLSFAQYQRQRIPVEWREVSISLTTSSKLALLESPLRNLEVRLLWSIESYRVEDVDGDRVLHIFDRNEQHITFRFSSLTVGADSKLQRITTRSIFITKK